MAVMKYQTKITLYNSYFDYNNKISPAKVLAIFQDVAAHHAEELGVGYLPMLEKNLFWVVSRIKFDVICEPQINQTVIVETWPHEKGRIDFDRDYLISDEQGKVLIKGTSKWCVINTTTRALSRTDEVNYCGEYYSKVNYTEKFAKTPNFETSGMTPVYNHKVYFCELDHNKHMNNTNYANLVLNVIENKNINHFQINFINECKLDDVISIYYLKQDGVQLVSGYVDGKVVFTAEVNA